MNARHRDRAPPWPAPESHSLGGLYDRQGGRAFEGACGGEDHYLPHNRG